MARLFTVLIAATLVFAACGDTGSTEVTVTQPDGVAATDAPQETTATTEAAGEATLADYLPIFGPGGDDPEEQQAFWRNQEVAAQEFAARCMAEQGFEYIPFVPDYGDSFIDWEATEGERRAEEGFGMAYYLLYEPTEEEFSEDDPWADDPNMAIVDAMSESEREAYYYALHGDDPFMEAEQDFDWENATEEEMRAFEEEMDRLWREREWVGCMELGWNEAGGFDDDVWMSFEDEFGDWWEEVDQRVQADPRFIEIQDDWVACMADAGFDFTDPETMHMELWEQFETLVDYPGDEFGTVVTIAPGVDVDSLEFVENEDGSVQWVDANGNVYTEADMEALWRPDYDETAVREFMDYEIAVAVAEWECGQGMWEEQDAIRTEYQNQWVAENKGALDAWKAAREAEG